MLKGPTAAFMEWAGRTLDAAGVAAEYGARASGGLLDAILADEPPAARGARSPLHVTLAPTLMSDAEQRRDVARAALGARRGGSAMSVVVVLPVKELRPRQGASRRDAASGPRRGSRWPRGC